MPENPLIHCVWMDPETGKQCPNTAALAVTWGHKFGSDDPTEPGEQVEACNQQHAEELVPEGADNVKIEELKFS